MIARFGENAIVRLLSSGDVDAAMELSSEAGWNQTPGDWRMLLTLEPEGCFGCEVDGRLVSTATLLRYGSSLGWIGMVLTSPGFRRRGFARNLLGLALRRAGQLGISTLKLDATDQGRRLYESLGFRVEQPIERWRRDASAMPSRPANPGACEPDLHLDRAAIQADRSQLLAVLARRHPPIAAPGGFLLWRDGNCASYLGPCIADGPAIARELLQKCLELKAGNGWFWDLLPNNRHAVDLAQEFGFIMERRLVRMVRGTPSQGKEDWIYAIAGFELG